MDLPRSVAGLKRNDGAEGGVGGKEAEWKHISYGREMYLPPPPGLMPTIDKTTSKHTHAHAHTHARERRQRLNDKYLASDRNNNNNTTNKFSAQ